MQWCKVYEDILQLLEYPFNMVNGVITFSPPGPTQTLQDAISGLPTVDIELWNLDVSIDPLCAAVRDATTGTEWTKFTDWHEQQYWNWLESQMDLAPVAKKAKIKTFWKMLKKEDNDAQDTIEAIWTANGLTRMP